MKHQPSAKQNRDRPQKGSKSKPLSTQERSPQSQASSPSIVPRGKKSMDTIPGKWIVFQTRAWVLVEKTGLLLETTSLRISKGGIYLRSLTPIAVGTPILVLLVNKPNLSADYVRNHKHVVKGKVIDLEREPMMCKITVQITLGRVDPSTAIRNYDETKYWWSRSWQ